MKLALASGTPNLYSTASAPRVIPVGCELSEPTSNITAHDIPCPTTLDPARPSPRSVRCQEAGRTTTEGTPAQRVRQKSSPA